jgi:hypothetical protein
MCVRARGRRTRTSKYGDDGPTAKLVPNAKNPHLSGTFGERPDDDDLLAPSGPIRLSAVASGRGFESSAGTNTMHSPKPMMIVYR